MKTLSSILAKRRESVNWTGSGVFCSFRKSKINDLFWMAGGGKQVVKQ